MPGQKTILIAAANPSNEARLRLDIEVRDIKERLNSAKHRDLFELKQIGATRVRDLQTAMQQHEPTIVHFCGHGAGDSGIVLEDNAGKTQLVSTEALANFFELFVDEVECVVLNACFSEIQAKEIVKHIPYVIGMKKGIGDEAAIEFAVGFYGTLASGKDYEKAFKFGCSAIELMGIPESLTPQLFVKEGYSQANISVKKEGFPMSSNTDLRQKKLQALEKALILETDASVKFKLENEIAELREQIANSPK